MMQKLKGNDRVSENDREEKKEKKAAAAL